MSFLLSLPLVGGTNSYFGDSEISSFDRFMTPSLDAELTSVQVEFTPSSIGKGEQSVREIKVYNNSLVPFNYQLFYEYKSGNSVLCDSLLLQVTSIGEVVYTGLLHDFDFNYQGYLLPFLDHIYQFELLVPVDSSDQLSAQSCLFAFDLLAWQKEYLSQTTGFLDEEQIVNSVTTANWGVSAGAGVSAGDVVINEIMWTGSSEGARDEWIELRNMTDHPIDIGQWVIENARASNQPSLMIPASHVIPAYGYFLIANYPEQSTNTALYVVVNQPNGSLSFLNSGEQLVLREATDGIIIDSTPLISQSEDSWAAGMMLDNKYYSMQRELIPGDGTDSGNWYSCFDESCNDGIYWDTVDGPNYGTPQGANSPRTTVLVIESLIPLTEESTESAEVKNEN